MPSVRDYVALGEQALQELLDAEHAVVWQEVEAKIADRPWHTQTKPVNPHHLTTARQNLLARGVIIEEQQVTRGGRRIRVFVPVDRHRRARAIEDAAARKRLLQARFLGWASGSAASGAGVIGPAGERIVHRALTAAAPYGYRLINPDRGETRTLLGAPVPSGPLDNAAFLTTLDGNTFTPNGQYLVLVEVKNIRAWIYPSTQELHQLLDKASRIHQDHPEQRLLPVLICRQAHHTTTQMARDLGFYVIPTKRQYVPASLAGRELDEVRTELGYDLEPIPDQPPPALVRHFTQVLQGVAARTADRWPLSAQHLAPYFTALRNEHERDRGRLLQALREDARHAHGEDVGAW